MASSFLYQLAYFSRNTAVLKTTVQMESTMSLLFIGKRPSVENSSKALINEFSDQREF